MKRMSAGILVVLLLQPSLVRGQETPPPGVALHLAALTGNIEAVQQHIKAGSDLNEKDAYGSTPLIVATAFGRTEVAKALIEAGADLHLANSEGGTALHTAAFLCRTEIVQALLDYGANKYLRDGYGNTPAQSVSAPFEDVRDTYDRFAQALGPLGLELDYEQIRLARPRIAEMLWPRTEELEAVDYAPLPGGDWKVSTPAEQGLDPKLVAELFLDASGLSTLYGLLVVKNGHLIAEGYFNDGSVDQLSGRQSATKSFTSALVGVALDHGCLTSVDQKMMEFFPELAGQIDDPQKEQITIRDLLQMRGGYPWEERVPQYFDTLFFSDNWHWIPHLADIPLASDPGTEFGYSNLTSHLLAVIVARACDTDLKTFAQEHLFSPMDAELGDWTADPDGYRWGWGEIHVTARDMAKFGSMYLNDGEYLGTRVLPADWVRDSLRRYSGGIKDPDGSSSTHGRYLRDRGYGYQWWSASVGERRIDYAAGHGGNLIVLLDDLDIIVVTTADPLYELPSSDGWVYEGAIVDLVGKFIESLPKE